VLWSIDHGLSFTGDAVQWHAVEFDRFAVEFVGRSIPGFHPGLPMFVRFADGMMWRISRFRGLDDVADFRAFAGWTRCVCQGSG